SGLVREGRDFIEWIDSVAHGPAIGPNEIDEKIIAPRSKELQRRTGRPFELRAFQRGAGLLGRRALLLAACGTGKTLAAWKWAEARARSEDLGRIIFLYPTRGTATEGFRDYVAWAPETDASLLHSSAHYELDGMMENPPESAAGKNFLVEADERLFSLAQ